MPVSCECIRGLPLNDKLDAIYCAFYTAISNPVALPSCECVKGQPLLDKIDSIYCAILQFTQGAGGEIDPNDIQGATPYGISLLQLSAPQASALISSDGATALVLDPTDSITQNISVSQISDATDFGKNILQLATTGVSGPVTLQYDGTASQVAGTSGTYDPAVTSQVLELTDGVATSFH